MELRAQAADLEGRRGDLQHPPVHTLSMLWVPFVCQILLLLRQGQSQEVEGGRDGGPVALFLGAFTSQSIPSSSEKTPNRHQCVNCR